MVSTEAVLDTPTWNYLEGPWRPQPGPQTDAIRKAWVDELLYGGARGGGKTAWLLGDFAQDVPRPGGENWHGVIFRRTFPQLEEVIRQSQETYPRWFDPENRGLVRWMAGEKTWRWANGATLKMRYAESDDDWMQYQGHQYTWIGFDELTSWPTPEIYMRMKATLRSRDPRLKHKRIRATANPGGPGHLWVMNYYGIDQYPLGNHMLTSATGESRMFIKSRVQDNRVLMDADPQYISRLQGLGSPALVAAWLEGDWSAVPGAYFPEFAASKHVIRPFQIPDTWTRIAMKDWGSAAPGAVLWAAISDGQPVDGGRIYPKGAMVVYREWYIATPDDKGRWVGLGLTAEETGEGISDRTGPGEQVNSWIMDPAAFAQNGGPSLAERIARATDGRVMFRRGDNKRIPGWDQVRSRLKGNAEGPLIYFFANCTHIIRTLPALQHDPNKIEDVDTDGEDHVADALRYGCMSRPVTTDPPMPIAPPRPGYVLDDLWKEHDRTLRSRR